MSNTARWMRKRRAARRRCGLCGQEIRPGEAFYALRSRVLCAACLPLAAPTLLLPWRDVAGEEARR